MAINFFFRRCCVPIDELFNEEAPDDFEKTAKMLMAMSKMGMPSNLMAVLLDFGISGKLDKVHRLFLAGPIIQHKSQWRETTPPWLYQAVAYDRLQVVLDERSAGKVGWTIGPVEITTALYPATMEAPMHREYADIYLWASAQANAYHYNMPVDHFWEIMGGYKVTDDDILNPKGRYHYAYKELCMDIRRKVVDAAIQYERAEKKEAKNKSKSNRKQPPPTPGIQDEQLSLF